MIIILVWLLAYCVAGTLYVHMDVKGDIFGPAYTRTAAGRWGMRFLWLPATFLRFSVMALRRQWFFREAWIYLRTQAGPAYLAFFGVGLIGTWLISN